MSCILRPLTSAFVVDEAVLMILTMIIVTAMVVILLRLEASLS